MHSYHSVSLCFLSTRHVLPQRRRLQADRSRMKVRETKGTKGTKETKGTCCVIEQYCLSGIKYIKYIKCIKCIKCIETDGMISILFNFCSTTFVPRLLFHDFCSPTFVPRLLFHDFCSPTFVSRKAIQQNIRVKKAATFVQSYYRGHLSRRLMTIYFVASIRIQRWFISIKSKRLWSALRLDVRHRTMRAQHPLF